MGRASCLFLLLIRKTKWTQDRPQMDASYEILLRRCSRVARMGHVKHRAIRRHKVEIIEWKYKEIKAHGSDELKLAIEIITGGHKPGKATKEEKEDGNDYRN